MTKERLERFTAPAVRKADILIDKFFTKAIKPQVRKTIRRTKVLQTRARDAVKTIINLKNKLNLTDEFGEVTGKLPENLNQFSQSIEQAKNIIFKQWDDLIKIGEKSSLTGIFKGKKQTNVIDLKKIVSTIDDTINQTHIKLKSPETIQYAQAIKERFIEQGQITTREAQNLIQEFNKSLKAFYRNPTVETASRPAVDEGIVSGLRKALDDVIEKTVRGGDQFRPLKNQYTALKEIEQDVTRRTLVDARRNTKGLIDFTDVFSGGDVIRGIVARDPAFIAKGGLQKIISTIFKSLNNPNNQIKNMFKQVDKLLR